MEMDQAKGSSRTGDCEEGDAAGQHQGGTPTSPRTRSWRRSEPCLRTRLALAGNRSWRYAPAGSSNGSRWCSGMPASSHGACPAVIIHSEEICGVESFRWTVGQLFERHFMPLSMMRDLAGIRLRRARRAVLNEPLFAHPTEV